MELFDTSDIVFQFWYILKINFDTLDTSNSIFHQVSHKTIIT